MKKFKSLLLLKLPYCTHPDALNVENDFRTKLPFRPIPSLALATLCGFLDKYKTYNYDIKAIDLNIEAYTEPGIPIDTSNYLDLLTNAIKNSNYDILCISTMFVFNVRWVDDVVKLSRKFHPEAKIILGGGYPTVFPERCFKEHDIDDVIIGEGEPTLLHILNRYNNHQDPEFEKKFPFEGYASKNENGKIVISKSRHRFMDLGDLPIPEWNCLDIEKYFKRSGGKTLPIEGTRGCPYRCSFCNTYLSWGLKVRYKPIKNIINEIVELKKRYNVASLHFIDDNLAFSKKWMKEFLEQMIKIKLPLKLEASNFSIKHLDKEIIDLLVRAGMNRIAIAVESGSSEIQKRINKNIDFDKVRELVKIMKSRKVYIHICWMIGFPNETIEQIKSTFNFARELKAHSNQFLTVLPFPGTQLFEEAKRDNLLFFQEDDLDKFDDRKCDYLKSDEWDYDLLRDMIYDINIEVNFLNNSLLDTAEGRYQFLEYLKGLLLRLPEHIIARIIAGYLYKQKRDYSKSENYYKSAIELFRNKTLHKTFFKYLSWDNPVIKDFNQFLLEKKL